MPSSKMEEFLRNSSDFEISDSIFCWLCEKYGDSHSADWTNVSHRVVDQIWLASGDLDNGGFCYWLQRKQSPNNFDYKYTMEAFELIGLTEMAKAFKELLSYYPNGVVPEDHNLRLELYEKIPENIRENIDRIASKQNKKIEKPLADFIRVNASDFDSLLEK
ncbi:DUF4375 domain-containing protein [Telmatocola sphagniphila]|uniref:DUF4375 domain-containing protein n=1 Tax=Telmatocola sphagniphila TaxID=1123043 RepID=A0A8E6B6W9_9BACT|nr:DUF4375 domain-containing protein [Telmatocola sphagniphila]QVL32271.1 DUF4375 domain-containing protein [Telmatocola sphagniphila]